MAKDQDAPINLPRATRDELINLSQRQSLSQCCADAIEAILVDHARLQQEVEKYKNALESISGCVDVDYAIKRAQVALGELPASVFDGYISDTAREIWKDDKEK